MHLLNQVSRMFTLSVSSLIQRFADEALKRVKRFFLGVFLFLVSIVFWLTGFILIFLALFFYFAGNPDLVVPGVKTAIVSMGVGLAVTVAGIWLLKKKKFRKSANAMGSSEENNLVRELLEAFFQESKKVIDAILAGCKKEERPGGQGAEANDTNGAQNGLLWLKVLSLFVLGFITGMIVKSIKRKPQQSKDTPDTPDTNANKPSYGTNQK